MKRLVALMMGAVSFGAAAQITYPYNPDEDGNGQIAVGDLQGILSTYGNAFSPSEILVDGETLTTVLTQLQNSIDSLSGLTGGGGSVLDMPLGTVLPIATESVPEGWMLCDGREISIEEYQGLYDLIGTTYGAGDSAFWAQVFYPATTFNIPDLRGRTIIGSDNMGGTFANTVQNVPRHLGQIGGEQNHSLSAEELPQLLLDLGGVSVENGGCQGLCEGYLVGGFNGDGYSWQLIAGESEISNGGGDQPHNNMQPYMALNYMVKVKAIEDVVGSLIDRIDQLESQLSLITFGCSDPTSCNYDEDVLVDDGSCTGLKGCTDTFASNFNPSATCDDDSCIPYFGMFGFGGIVIDVDEQNHTATILCSAAGPTSGSTTSALYSLVSTYEVNGFDDWILPSYFLMSDICSELSLLNGVLLLNGGDVLGDQSVHTAASCGTVNNIPHNLGINLSSCNYDNGNYCSGSFELRPIRMHQY